MAAKVVTGMQEGATEIDNSGPGVSYASVLFPRGGATVAKANGNNKENESGQIRPPPPKKVSDDSSKPKGNNHSSYPKANRKFGHARAEKRPAEKAREKGLFSSVDDKDNNEKKDTSEKKMENGDVGTEDGGFQMVAPKSARRKEKVKEVKEHTRNGPRERHRPVERRQPRAPNDASRERREHKDKEKNGVEHHPVKEPVKEENWEQEQDSDKPVKYVEAPLPTHNPWTKSKIAAPVKEQPPAPPQPAAVVAVPVPQPIVAPPPAPQPEPSTSKSAPPAPLVEKEKRVLQPQQQRTENNVNSSQPIVKATKDRRKINNRANSDFTDTVDWPSLGTQGEKRNSTSTTSKQNGVESSNSKENSVSPVDNKGKENKEQNHCPEFTEEHNNEVTDKKKKVNTRQKWVPLDIDIAKSRGKRDRSPKPHYHRERNDEENHRERDHDRQNYSFRGGRGRSFRNNRGGRNHGMGRNNIRQRQDSDVHEYAAEYFPVVNSQINNAQGMEPPPFPMTYNMTPYYYDYREPVIVTRSSNIPQQDEEDDDGKRMKDNIRKQVEYYFSEENLCKDFFIRRKMDTNGYLPISLIATFRRILNMNADFTSVYEAILESDKLEIDENFKVRTKFNPEQWVILDPMAQPMYPENPQMYNDSLSAGYIPQQIPGPLINFCPIAPALSALPEPPIPKVIQTVPIIEPEIHVPGDSLNPNVPEFIPTSVSLFEENAQAVVQNVESLTQNEVETTSEHNAETTSTEKVASTSEEANDESAAETSEHVLQNDENKNKVTVNGEKDLLEEEKWEEVRRRVKPPPKDKADEKSGLGKEEEREELEFFFDEELQDIPPSRQNAFSECSVLLGNSNF